MTPLRTAVSASVLVAVGVLGLSACSGEKPSGLAAFTPSPSGNAASASPTSASKWTPEQQQVIDGFDKFTDYRTATFTKTEKIDMAKAHQVAQEPFATKYMKRIDATLSAGFVQTGKVVNTIASVTVAGEKATIKTCQDQTHTKLTKPSDPSAPAVKTLPPAMATVSLAREGDAWKVAGFTGGEGKCITG